MWFFFLYFDICVILGCVIITLTITTRSPGMIDVLGNAFTVLILAEYGKLVSNYLISRLESDDLSMTSRDDFMRFEIDPLYQKASLYWFNFFCILMII